jgi:hypothetical protein
MTAHVHPREGEPAPGDVFDPMTGEPVATTTTTPAPQPPPPEMSADTE